MLVHFPTPAILLAAEEAELVEVIAAASKSGYGFAKKKAELLISAAQKHRPWEFIPVPMRRSLCVRFKCFVHYPKVCFKLKKQ